MAFIEIALLEAHPAASAKFLFAGEEYLNFSLMRQSQPHWQPGNAIHVGANALDGWIDGDSF